MTATEPPPPDPAPVSAADMAARLTAAAAAGREGLDPDVLSAATNLKRAATVLDQIETARVHAPAGQSPAAFRTLVMVHAFGPIAAKDVSRLAGVSRQAVSGVLATLERGGLVRRERATRADRRLAPVTITRKGRSTVDRLVGPQNRAQAAFFGGLDAAERRTLLDLLSRLAGAR
jgi:DNA-binding MarR family transcriptional regulator